MSKSPFFSIIIPCLNEEQSLPLLLEDLVNQSLKNFEVIIVDSQSKDNTVKKALAFQKLLPSLTILESKIRNVSFQRNMGGEQAKGEYLLFNDADNRLPQDFISKLSSRLSNDHIDAFTVSMQTANLRLSHLLSIIAINLYTLVQQKTRSPYVVEALFGIKTKLFHSLNGFRTDLPVSEGTDLLKRAKAGGSSFIVFLEPKYSFSLRRLEKEGAVKMMVNISKIELLRFLGHSLTQKEAEKIYPMNGGNYYEQNND